MILLVLFLFVFEILKFVDNYWSRVRLALGINIDSKQIEICRKYVNSWNILILILFDNYNLTI